MSGEPLDPRTFRHVLGQFCTGITIITTLDGDVPIGFACQSFAALSLEPPLVLFCPTKMSRSWQAIEASGKFCVNVLTEKQREYAPGSGRRSRTSSPASTGTRPSSARRSWTTRWPTSTAPCTRCTTAAITSWCSGWCSRSRRCRRSSRARCCSTAASTPASSRTRTPRPVA